VLDVEPPVLLLGLPGLILMLAVTLHLTRPAPRLACPTRTRSR
jgi:hypothetical protein